MCLVYGAAETPKLLVVLRLNAIKIGMILQWKLRIPLGVNFFRINSELAVLMEFKGGRGRCGIAIKKPKYESNI